MRSGNTRVAALANDASPIGLPSRVDFDVARRGAFDDNGSFFFSFFEDVNLSTRAVRIDFSSALRGRFVDALGRCAIFLTTFSSNASSNFFGARSYGRITTKSPSIICASELFGGLISFVGFGSFFNSLHVGHAYRSAFKASGASRFSQS